MKIYFCFYRKDVDKLFEYWCEFEYQNNQITVINSFPKEFNQKDLISCIPYFAFPHPNPE